MTERAQLPKSIEVWVCPKCGSFRGHAGLCRNAMATEHTTFYPDRPDMTGPHRYVLAVPTDEMVERLRERVMSFGGFQRTPRGEFWISRESVMRAIEEELARAAASSTSSEESDHG